MSNIEALNSLLATIAESNDGSDHLSDYSLAALPPADSIALALDTYYSAISTSNSSPQPPERWNIRMTELTDSTTKLRTVAKHWFYKLESSSTVDDTTVELILDEFMNRLYSIVGTSKVFEVKVDPPMWYECVWQDFAFDGEADRWLLHFGFSD